MALPYRDSPALTRWRLAAARGKVDSGSDLVFADDDNADTGRDKIAVDRDIGPFPDGIAVAETGKVPPTMGPGRRLDPQ